MGVHLLLDFSDMEEGSAYEPLTAIMTRIGEPRVFRGKSKMMGFICGCKIEESFFSKNGEIIVPVNFEDSYKDRWGWDDVQIMLILNNMIDGMNEKA